MPKAGSEATLSKLNRDDLVATDPFASALRAGHPALAISLMIASLAQETMRVEELVKNKQLSRQHATPLLNRLTQTQGQLRVLKADWDHILPTYR